MPENPVETKTIKRKVGLNFMDAFLSFFGESEVLKWVPILALTPIDKVAAQGLNTFNRNLRVRGPGWTLILFSKSSYTPISSAMIVCKQIRNRRALDWHSLCRISESLIENEVIDATRQESGLS